MDTGVEGGVGGALGFGERVILFAVAAEGVEGGDGIVRATMTGEVQGGTAARGDRRRGGGIGGGIKPAACRGVHTVRVRRRCGRPFYSTLIDPALLDFRLNKSVPDLPIRICCLARLYREGEGK